VLVEGLFGLEPSSAFFTFELVQALQFFPKSLRYNFEWLMLDYDNLMLSFFLGLVDDFFLFGCSL